jgi:hypothetical protein
MDILGDRKFVNVPGSKTHELPPLLVRGATGVKRLDRVMEMATGLVEQEDLLADPDVDVSAQAGAPGAAPDYAPLLMERERRRMDLAINLVEQYLGLVSHWQWGDDVLEWIRQCETTFGCRMELRNLLRTELWPHAGRSSFVRLLEDKAIDTHGIGLEKAVGLRLTFRQPPPIKCFSNQFLFYLNSTVANTAYHTWESMSQTPVSSLPPERFTFDVVNIF